jgi:ATP-dependent protease ClpP protease subunit
VKQGNIYIGPTPENPEGVIGSYTDEKGMQIKGVELIDVIGQVKNQPQASSFLVRIKSPGGLVDSGNAIYDYFESLKAQGIQVDTITAGDIGSIATKIFLAGTNRTIVDGHEFFIHNPWTEMVGDSNKVALELTALKQTENELRSFYQAHTKITDAGLKGLMDAQTGMSADQAVTLGFATKKLSASKIKAFALLKPNSDMSKENFAQKLIAAIDSAFTNHKAEGVAAPAQAAASPAPTDGSASPLMGKPVMIDGQAAPDGVYTVVGGMVTAVESVSERHRRMNPAGVIRQTR